MQSNLPDGALRHSLKDQLHAALAMLDDCVERCPDDLWTSAPNPAEPQRTVWRIAFHAAFFAHFYLGQSVEAFEPYDDPRGDAGGMWRNPAELDPYDLPADAPPYAREEIRAYIRFVDALVDRTVEALDLAAPETGFPWYPDMTKLTHELLNLRHLQGHVGQLSELLMIRGIDTRWKGRTPRSPA